MSRDEKGTETHRTLKKISISCRRRQSVMGEAPLEAHERSLFSFKQQTPRVCLEICLDVLQDPRGYLQEISSFPTPVNMTMNRS